MVKRLSKERRLMARVFLPILIAPLKTVRIIFLLVIVIWLFRAGFVGSFWMVN